MINRFFDLLFVIIDFIEVLYDKIKRLYKNILY